jgi:hypothetical protein
MTIWYILRSYGTFFSNFGILHQEKSGNPAKQLSCWNDFQNLISRIKIQFRPGPFSVKRPSEKKAEMYEDF